jgi:hypothetical protein
MSDWTTTRAGALRRLGLLLGGAGLGAAGGLAISNERGGAKGAVGNDVTRIRVHAAQLAFSDPEATPTSFLQVPSRLVAAAQLADDAGKARGSFTALRMPAGEGGLEFHTFTLDRGTLMGMGSASAKSYSIVGGTEEYAGVAGSYTMEHRAASAGGDGSADFVIDIARREQPWH